MSTPTGLASSKWALPRTITDFFATAAERIPRSSVPSWDKKCHICQTDFELSSQTEDAGQSENVFLLESLPFPEWKTEIDEPVRLPCGHIFGSSCLRYWLLSSEKTQCPLCKNTLFRMTASLEQERAGEYAEKMERIRSTPFHALMVPRWHDEQTLLVPKDATAMLERIPLAMVKVSSRLSQITIPWNARLGYATPFGEGDCAANYRTAVANYSGSRFSDFLLTREAEEVYVRLCREIRDQAGQEWNPEALHFQLRVAMGRPGKILKMVVKMAMKAVLEYERLVGELDSTCS